MKQLLNYTFIAGLLALIFFTGCAPKDNLEKLPVLGRKNVISNMDSGVLTYDTTYHQIADFLFVNQDSMIITNDSFKDKIYVADFFFTTCPTICPIMKAQMLRVYEEFKNNDHVLILSHTIDPNYDTVALLHDFADRLGVASDKWHFVTGLQEEIYDIGQNSYMVSALEDQNVPGGYIHSGAFILVDKERHIRGMYDGTKEDQVNRLIKDIPRLIKEYEIQ